ncbi:MAG: tetratricopeptide repeat protein [Longimicrobiales bacterium]|nr:tetratricopeptide repeat protein [Longimicrobiales bacterium]
MNELVDRLKQRKVVQWAVAYAAAAWVVIEVLSVLGEIFGLPVALQRGAVLALGAGLVLTVVLAWYHGEKGRQRVSGPELLIIAGVLVVAGAAIHLAMTPAQDPTATAPAPSEGAEGTEAPDPRSVAVLPFRDMSPNADHRYLSEGVAEELIGVLSRSQELKVASRTASFAVAEAGLELREIGRRLDVRHVVEGSVRRAQDRLRVQAALLDVEDGFPLWSGRFDTDVSDIFSVQDSIARSVADALEATLAGESGGLTPGGTADHRAQDLYFKGRYAWNRRSRPGLEQAVAYFDSAVARDSLYARALAGLGDAYAVLGFYDYRSPDVAFPRAQQAARRALRIDSTLAEPYATLGYVALYYDWDWPRAEARFRRAIELDPGYPVAHQWYANYLTAMGRFEEAEREMRRASELDPLSMIAFMAIGWVDYYARDYQEAIRQLGEATRRDPDFELAYLWSAQAHQELGLLEEAERAARRAVALSGGSRIARAALAGILGAGGRTLEARSILEALAQEGRVGYVPSYEIARAYVGLGELATALEWLERARQERAHSMVFLEVDPALDPLRGRDDFRSLLDRVGL